MSKRYGRRAFLGGSIGGATALIGLPFLEALAPRKAFGQAGAAPKRFLGYWNPNGMFMDDWRPVGTGANFTFGPAMGPMGRVWADGLPAFPASEDGPGLDSVKDKILVLSGLQNTLQEGKVPGDHSGGTGSFMTNRTVSKASNATMKGPSIDFLISKTTGQTTKRPYLAIGGELGRPAGVFCDSGFACSVGDHISFNDVGEPVPRVDNAATIFDMLFTGGAVGNPMADAAALARRKQDTSILDLVRNEATSLQPKLSRQDRPRLDEYLTSIREVERRIMTATMGGGGMACMPGTKPGAITLDQGRVGIDVMHELMALAFQCDATRVISFQWGNSTSNRPHTFIGASGGHHDISHHGGDATKVAKIKRIDYWWHRRFAALVKRLSTMPDIDGKMVIDNTLIFQGSDVSNGDKHNHDDMPVLVAGGAAGFRLGQHVNTNGAWFGDLFLSIAKGFGINNVATFGEMGKTPLDLSI